MLTCPRQNKLDAIYFPPQVHAILCEEAPEYLLPVLGDEPTSRKENPITKAAGGFCSPCGYPQLHFENDVSRGCSMAIFVSSLVLRLPSWLIMGCWGI